MNPPPLGHSLWATPPELDSWDGKCRCGTHVQPLRIGNAVADEEFRKSVRPLRISGKGVADFAGGAALLATLRMDLRNQQQQNRCALSRNMRAMGGRVIMC